MHASVSVHDSLDPSPEEQGPVQLTYHFTAACSLLLVSEPLLMEATLELFWGERKAISSFLFIPTPPPLPGPASWGPPCKILHATAKAPVRLEGLPAWR